MGKHTAARRRAKLQRKHARADAGIAAAFVGVAAAHLVNAGRVMVSALTANAMIEEAKAEVAEITTALACGQMTEEEARARLQALEAGLVKPLANVGVDWRGIREESAREASAMKTDGESPTMAG